MIIFLVTCQIARADCDPSIAGTWQLDYQHYLDMASKGDASAREKLNEVWEGRSFVKLSLDPGIGRGSHASRLAEGWHTYHFSYQITEAQDRSCTMTIISDGGDSASQHETHKLRATDNGFCLLPLESDRWEE